MSSPRRIKSAQYSWRESRVVFPVRVYNYVDQNQDYYIEPKNPITFDNFYNFPQRPRTASPSRLSHGLLRAQRQQDSAQQYKTNKYNVCNNFDEFDSTTPSTFLITQIDEMPQQRLNNNTMNKIADAPKILQINEEQEIMQPMLNIDTFINCNLPSPLRAQRQRPLSSTLSKNLRYQPIKNQPVDFVIEYSTQQISFDNKPKPRRQHRPQLMSWGKSKK